MGAAYSVLGFLSSVPVGEMLAEYIVIIGVISLIKDEVTESDAKRKYLQCSIVPVLPTLLSLTDR